jgi:hypothetical protein
MSDKKVNPQSPAPVQPPSQHKELGHVPASQSQIRESKTEVVTFFSPPPAPAPPKQNK